MRRRAVQRELGYAVVAWVLVTLNLVPYLIDAIQAANVWGALVMGVGILAGLLSVAGSWLVWSGFRRGLL